jgi:hypothetical protein
MFLNRPGRPADGRSFLSDSRQQRQGLKDYETCARLALLLDGYRLHNKAPKACRARMFQTLKADVQVQP